MYEDAEELPFGDPEYWRILFEQSPWIPVRPDLAVVNPSGISTAGYDYLLATGAALKSPYMPYPLPGGLAAHTPGRQNLPPLARDGSAVREAPQILALPAFSPIGTGIPNLREIRACQGSGEMYDITTWSTGLGQVANSIGIINAAGTQKSSVVGAGIAQIPFMLPSDYSVGYVSADDDLYIANASAGSSL